jgi:(p)ppGpp synthase/HD superfamily hydrolase
MMSDIVERAAAFAERAHAGQQRKFTGEPYINHPRAVLALVRTVPHTAEMECTALLHDTVEDTGVAIAEIEKLFGSVVAQYVLALTDDTSQADGDRAARKRAVVRRLAQAPDAAKTVKLADVIDNIHNVAERDAVFARSYMQEKRAVLPALQGGDATLWRRAMAIVDAYFARAGEAAD